MCCRGSQPGSLITTVAFAEPGSARPPQHPDTTAARTGDSWQVTGEKTYVLDAVAADRILCPGRI